MQGRVLCRISLVFILVMIVNAYTPISFIGVYDKPDVIDECLAEGETVSATGYIYHKEIKNDKVLYYVRNASISSRSGILSKTSFIFKLDSDDIPNYSKLNISSAKIKHFKTATNDGCFDMKNYYNSLGLFVELEKISGLSAETNAFTEKDIFYGLQKSISDVFKACLPYEESGFLSSVVLGQKGDLNSELKLLFQNVGIAHILAVSGLHVSVICMALYSFLRRRGAGYTFCALEAGTIAILYGLLTGGSISSIRAIGMFIIFLGSQVFGESYDMLTALSLMADILLISEPFYIKNSSFIFSFMAVIGVKLFAIPLSNQYKEYCRSKNKAIKSDSGFYNDKLPLKKRIIQYFVSGFIFSFGMFAAMLPIVTQLFYQTPIYGTLINLLVLPLMPVLLGAGIIAGFIGIYYLPLAKAMLIICHYIIYGYELISDKATLLPFANIIVGRRRPIAFVVYYCFLFIAVNYGYAVFGGIRKFIKIEKRHLFNNKKLVNMFSNCKRKFSNSEGKNKDLKARVFVSLLLVCISTSLWLLPSKGKFEIDILDVGQGDGIFINSGDGARFFIDGGSTTSKEIGKYTMSPFLKSKGVRSIDYWFLSHMDLDHVSGVLELLEDGYDIKHIVLSSEIPPGDTLSKLLALAQQNHTEIIYMNRGDTCGTKHVSFKCVFPGDDYHSDDLNSLSLSLLMEYDKNLDGRPDYSGFFGGDLGAEQEQIIAESGLIAHVNLLKVSHHGSRFSSDPTFLEKLSPDVAVISCAKVNRYGHPADEAIERLEATANEIFYTMYSGRVRINTTGVDEFVCTE